MKQDEVDRTRITRETYDQIASGYARRINHLIADTWVGRFEQSLLDELVSSVTVGEGRTIKILDIGCGQGKDTSYLSQKEGVIPIGLDYSSGMLAEARRSFPDIAFVQMDMRGLGFSDGSFDGVWANGCVYHVPKKELPRVLSGVRCVLKASGAFSFNFKAGAGERLEKNPTSYGGKPRFYAYYGIEEMKNLVARAGLKVMEVEPYPRVILGERIVQIRALKP
jgi:ubiquinone/menaquinone biosynthesis C-methylase UbiE